MVLRKRMAHYFREYGGVLNNLLPYREVILGARISPENEARIRDAVGSRDVKILRTVTDSSANKFEIRIQLA